MNIIKKYCPIVLLLLISNVWLAEADYNLKDLKGTSKIELISSSIYETSLEASVQDYMLVPLDDTDTKFKVFIDQGTSIIELGSPEIPKLSTSIIIPDNMEMEVNVTNYEYTEYSNVYLAPSKGNITRDIDPNTIPFRYGETYKENAFYPGELVQLEDPYILRDVRGQSVYFYPIQYNPFTKVLRVYDKINVELTSSNNSIGKNVLSRDSNTINTDSEFMHMYEDLFINSNNDTRFEYIADQGSMLIICYDDFIDEMLPLVNWKNKKGIRTEIVGLNEVGSSVSSMQNYIDNYYSSNGLTYLLLVGDINQIPTPIINGASSDPSFGFIEGDDSFAEVIVGRFSANNPAELQTQIDRTLQYEMDPGDYTQHFDQALGIASNQGPGYGGLADNEFNDLLWNDFLSDYTYESFQGIYDPNGSVSEGVNAVNEGVGVINYTGHAGPTGWGNGAPLGVNDVNGLNNAGKLPFIFTVGCNPGEFNNYGECFCEAWLRATDSNGNPVGAVGHLGSTISQSWEPPMHGQWAMNAILTEAFDENTSRSYGGISVNGCMHMNEAQGSYGINETNHWTIFGDPSLLVRTDQPNTLNAVYDATILVGQDEFVVDVGVNGALVALSSNGDLLSSAYSIGGVAVLDLSDVSTAPGEVDLVISSFNTIPIQEVLTIITPEGAFLVYSDYELVGTNNFDDFIQYGDQVEINLIIENVGVENTNAISINVSSNDQYITMIDSYSMIAYAIAGETATTEEAISFSVLNSVPDGHLASFEAILDDGANQWTITFNIEIHAPVFEVLDPQIEDSNMDGVWDAGETATITVDLVNSGSANFGNYPGAVISTDSPYVTVLSGESDNTFYGIVANDSYEGTFYVEADASTPMGTIVDFNISWGYSPISECFGDCVEQANLIYSVAIGHPAILIWDPSDNHTSGQRLTEYFDEVGFSGYSYVTSTDVSDLENYLVAFIFLGIYSNNFVLSEASVTGFVEMLNSGKSIYLEGNDTWAFDMQTSLQSMFGLIGVADGSGDLSTLSGAEGTFAEGMTFTYNGENAYIDQLSPSEGFALLYNDSPSYTTAVGYENETYRTIGASHELGGLQGEDFTAYIEGILDFFDAGGGNSNPDPECVAGDVNSDGSTDVVDVVRVVNIIINFDGPFTEVELCAADINADGEVNVLDVLIVINIILDDSQRQTSENRQAKYIVDEAELIIYDNKLELLSDGPIKGIQFTLNSSDVDLEIHNNFDINKDIELVSNPNNPIGDKHYYIIYSTTGKCLDDQGLISLDINTKKSFEVVEFLASNTNHKLIDVKYSNAILPDIFLLKQNYPNPFNPSTNIEIEIGTADNIKLTIYDIQGREIISLINGFIDSGSHSFIWNGKDKYGHSVASGVYIYTLINSSSMQSQKMLLLK